MSFNLGFIGGGNMSTAIVQGILKNSTHQASKIWVSGPRVENLKQWKIYGANVTEKNSEVYLECDIIFLGVKPQLLDQALEDCLSLPNGNRNRDVLFVSMLAGIKIQTLNEKLKTLSPNPIRVIRIMPNMPMTVGVGACLLSRNAHVRDEECQQVEQLLNSCAIVETVPETMIDALGSLSACGPAFMYIVIEALADGAVKQGVPRNVALRLASQMVAGSAQMVLQTGKHPGLLKDEVCSPGGSTISGVTALENGKIRATLINAIEAATLRTKELGNH